MGIGTLVAIWVVANLPNSRSLRRDMVSFEEKPPQTPAWGKEMSDVYSTDGFDYLRKLELNQKTRAIGLVRSRRQSRPNTIRRLVASGCRKSLPSISQWLQRRHVPAIHPATLAARQFLFKYFTPHRCFCVLKIFRRRHNLHRLVGLSPKDFNRLVDAHQDRNTWPLLEPPFY